MWRLLASLALLHAAKAIAIDNGVDGLPSVSCGMESVTITFSTTNPFLGRVFVKGMSKQRECVREYLNNTQPEGYFDLRLSACGMRRERKLAPTPGLEESITLVISFHYVFITKVDRAYRVICSYSQDSLAVVTHGLNVSMIPSVPLTPDGGSVQPECDYEIRRGGFQGPIALYAEVGDKLFHRWTCNGATGMKILVKSCIVSDGAGEMFVVVDDRGCSVDPVVVSDLTYNGNTAWVESHAFKFADTSFLGFSCTIQVCMVGEECQELSPPACSVEGHPGGLIRANRGRAKDQPLPILQDEVDVSAQSLSILDSPIFEKAEPSRRLTDQLINVIHQDSSAPFPDFPNAASDDSGQIVEKETSIPSSDVCLSKFYFGVLAVVTLGLLVLLGIVATVLYINLSRVRKTWANPPTPYS